jgi:hypothetical protein
VALVPARAVSPGRPTERASPVPDASRRTSSPHSRSLDGAALGWHRVSRSRQNGVDMSRIRAGRYTADLSDLDDEVVVFLIGMRVNRPWRVTEWWPVFTAMPRMLRYLQQHPDKGLLGFRQSFLPSPLLIQYWRSFGDLERFARDRNDPHLEPWRQFNRRVGASGDVGIWHETYRVRTADIETIYGNMPPSGLAAAVGMVPVQRGRDSAAARMGVGGEDNPALPPY